MECQIYWGISKTFRFYKNVQYRLNKNPFRLFNSTERVKNWGYPRSGFWYDPFRTRWNGWSAICWRWGWQALAGVTVSF